MKIYNLKNVEMKTIGDCLKWNDGNKRQTAKDLGISRASLYRKLEEYNIKYENGYIMHPQKQKVLELCS